MSDSGLIQRLGPTCRVNLSFGLHRGWAIEADREPCDAIGRVREDKNVSQQSFMRVFGSLAMQGFARSNRVTSRFSACTASSTCTRIWGHSAIFLACILQST